jgi:hypothetical protein
VFAVTARDRAGNEHTERWSYEVAGTAPKLRVRRRAGHVLRDGLRLVLTSAVRTSVRVEGVLSAGRRSVPFRAARAELEPGVAGPLTLKLRPGAARRLGGTRVLTADVLIASTSGALRRTTRVKLRLRR